MNKDIKKINQVQNMFVDKKVGTWVLNKLKFKDRHASSTIIVVSVLITVVSGKLSSINSRLHFPVRVCPCSQQPDAIIFVFGTPVETVPAGY